MLAYYGFKDGSGDWFIMVDTDKCNGCGKCVKACPRAVFEVGADDYDPFREGSVAKVTEVERKKLRYTCAPCRPGYRENPPCVAACESGAISHTEGWKLLYEK